ncbi:MAG: GNAT family N-acetyltransferase [Desulfobacterales bacterium]|nr:GNAT family N-acetyltransferase [Desulfobacterales bacterium]
MIRSAKPSDIPKIKELMKSEPGFWQDEWREDVLEKGLNSSGGLAFVWEEAGKILGFACAHEFGFRAYLSELIVAGPERKRGIAKKLVQHIENELASRRCNILIADVWEKAEGFYKSLGWSKPNVILLRKRLADKASQQSLERGKKS